MAISTSVYCLQNLKVLKFLFGLSAGYRGLTVLMTTSLYVCGVRWRRPKLVCRHRVTSFIDRTKVAQRTGERAFQRERYSASAIPSCSWNPTFVYVRLGPSENCRNWTLVKSRTQPQTIADNKPNGKASYLWRRFASTTPSIGRNRASTMLGQTKSAQNEMRPNTLTKLRQNTNSIKPWSGIF